MTPVGIARAPRIREGEIVSSYPRSRIGEVPAPGALVCALPGCSSTRTSSADNAAPQFKGKIELDVRKSTADWTPYTPKRAPEGSPNVLIVLYDDTGLAAWSPYGGRINMPTLQKLADHGLIYTQ